MLVKNVRRRLSRPRDWGGISQAKTGSSAKASASTSPSKAASSRQATRTAWEPPRDAISWVIGSHRGGCDLYGGSDPCAGLAFCHPATPRTPSRAEQGARIGPAASLAEAPSPPEGRASQAAG